MEWQNIYIRWGVEFGTGRWLIGLGVAAFLASWGWGVALATKNNVDAVRLPPIVLHVQWIALTTIVAAVWAFVPYPVRPASLTQKSSATTPEKQGMESNVAAAPVERPKWQPLIPNDLKVKPGQDMQLVEQYFQPTSVLNFRGVQTISGAPGAHIGFPRPGSAVTTVEYVRMALGNSPTREEAKLGLQSRLDGGHLQPTRKDILFWDQPDGYRVSLWKDWYAISKVDGTLPVTYEEFSSYITAGSVEESLKSLAVLLDGEKVIWNASPQGFGELQEEKVQHLPLQLWVPKYNESLRGAAIFDLNDPQNGRIKKWKGYPMGLVVFEGILDFSKAAERTLNVRDAKFIDNPSATR